MPPPPPPLPPPPLIDELIEEVLLRLPPDSPASLVRAGLVCKRWRDLVSDPCFQRRLVDFHGRAPPMLGFLMYSEDFPYSYSDGCALFVPMSASGGGGGGLPCAKHCVLQPCDARHGRALLRRTHSSYGIVTWTPITSEKLKLPDSPPTATEMHPSYWTAAVLCAATATATGAACDHLDCHRHGPFIVVLVGVTIFREKFTCIYSSETGGWSEPTVAPQPAEDSASSIAVWIRSTLVRNKLYFVLQSFKSILEYNLCTRRPSFIKVPSRGDIGQIQLTTMEDGRLGFVRVEDSRLCLWARVREDEEPAGWVLSKVIELSDFVWDSWHHLVGSAGGARNFT